jgi:hypothetical protein
VIGEVNTAIRTARSAEAIRILAGERGRVLTPAERVATGRKVIDQLAVKVESGRNSLNHLAEVRAAQHEARTLDPALRKSLETLTAVAGRRLLAEGLVEVSARAGEGKWGEATARAHEWTGNLDKQVVVERASASAEFRTQRNEVREVLRDVAGVGGRLDALNNLRSGLDALQANRPAVAVTSLRRINLDNLPARLRTPTQGLRSLAELRQLARTRWDRAPNVKAIKDNVAHLERALADQPGGDATLGKRILQDLAVKAFVEGHAGEYRQLIPTDGPAEHASNLLRDLKAMALGEGGTVSTASAVERAAPTEPGKGTETPRGPPPGLKPLVPEGERLGWRPPVVEQAGADLPPLEKAAELGLALKGKVEAELKPEQANLEKDAKTVQQRLTVAYERVQAPELKERKHFAELEGILDRRLRPTEKVLARDLLSENKTPAQVLATLKTQVPVNEEEEFLDELKARLGRNLNADERSQALRLRKEGRKVAEIADILRS